VQHSFAHRSPPRRPYSNVKSRVLVATWSHGGWRNKARGEGTTRRGRFIGVEALDCTPLPHNEMLARTYSASNFGSITPLANQMTGLSQSANSECLNSWVCLGRIGLTPLRAALQRRARCAAEILLEHHAFSRQVVPFRLLRLELVCPLPQRRSGVQVTFFDPGRPSDFPELRGAVRPHAFGWPALFPVRYLWSLLRWEGQCMGAVGEPRKRPHCLMCFGYGGD
jgi:hypothetical protein